VSFGFSLAFKTAQSAENFSKYYGDSTKVGVYFQKWMEDPFKRLAAFRPTSQN